MEMDKVYSHKDLLGNHEKEWTTCINMKEC